jgi:hypothetical protein
VPEGDGSRLGLANGDSSDFVSLDGIIMVLGEDGHHPLAFVESILICFPAPTISGPGVGMADSPDTHHMCVCVCVCVCVSE